MWSRTARASRSTAGLVPRRDVHEPVRDLRLRHRVHSLRGDPRPAPGRAQGGAVLGHRRVHHRRRVPARHAGGDPESGHRGQGRGTGPRSIIEANFSTGFATLYLFVVSAAIFVCCLSILAATIRLCFGMARDNQLPISGLLAQGVAEPAHAGLDLHRGRGAGRCALHQVRGRRDDRDRGTGMIYLSYFLGNIVIMRARARGWPKAERAVPARPLGYGGQCPGVHLRRGDAGQLRLAAARRATPSRTRPAALLTLRGRDS